MLVAPPAAAHLLTDRLSRMLLLSTALAALSAGVGHVLAIRLPPLLGFPGVSTSSAGMIGVAAGLLLLLAVLFGPRHGLVSRAWRRFALQLRIAREDILGLLYRLEERDALRSTPLTVPMLRTLISTGPLATRWSLAGLRRAGLVESASSASPALLRLTPKGRQFAQQHVRTHRLWEVFLEQYLSLPADHVHAAAEQLEHIRGERLRADLAESVGDPALDPHGKRIPKRDGA
jgi:manganese/zinc/iron transport system permease protein